MYVCRCRYRYRYKLLNKFTSLAMSVRRNYQTEVLAVRIEPEANFPNFAKLESQCLVIGGNSYGESLQVLLYFLKSRMKMEDWPLKKFCEWNWRLCMYTVVVLTRDCQIFTGANICMASYFKIVTSDRLTRCLCNFFLFFVCFVFAFCTHSIFPSCQSVRFFTNLNLPVNNLSHGAL